jgi:hypothetical protein
MRGYTKNSHTRLITQTTYNKKGHHFDDLFWWYRTESNRRHKDFQSFALPTELRYQPPRLRLGVQK